MPGILSYPMQFVYLRAKSEADYMHRVNKGIEFWFLGILKLSELRAKDAFRLPEEELRSIDEDIAAVRQLFRKCGVDTGILRLRLRHELRHGAKIEPELEDEYLGKALAAATLRGSDRIWAQDLAGVLLNHPTDVLQSLLPEGPSKPYEKPGENSDQDHDLRRETNGSGKVPDPGAAKEKEEKPRDIPASGKENGKKDGKESRKKDGKENEKENRKEIGKESSNKDGAEGAGDSGSAWLAQLTARVRRLRARLLNKVQGQDHVVHAFCEGYFASELLAAGDTSRRQPRAVFAFVGPPGVGKTFLAEQAAGELGLPYMRFNMSTYSDHQSYTGLVGFEKSYQAAREGLLTGFVRKNPRCILLFDEIEKAHLNTVQLFLQVLDAGVLADRFHMEDVSFKDTIIIFTSNAGRSLYEEGGSADAAGVPRKILLKALETESDPRTGQPFFPAAITSRLATGWPLLFNHLGPHDLIRISERELQRVSGIFKDQYGIGGSFDPMLSTALLFREGGSADARTLRAQSELFFKNEIFKVCRLWGEESFPAAAACLKKVDFTVETENLPPEVSPLFYSEEMPEILLYGRDSFAESFRKNLPGYVIHHARNAEEALEIAGDRDIRLALVELAGHSASAAGPEGGRAAVSGAGPEGGRAAASAAGPEGGRAAASVANLEAGRAAVSGELSRPAPDLQATVYELPDMAPGQGWGQRDAGELFLSVGNFDFLPMAASVFQDGARLFASFRERLPEIPVYLLESPELPLDEELVMNFVRRGARGRIAVPDSDFSTLEDMLFRISTELWMQKMADRMAAERKVLSFETAPALSEDQTAVSIRLRDFSLRRAPDAEDSSSILDEAEKPEVRFADVTGCGEAKDELQFYVDYLKDPKKFSARGLKPPRGVLLYGPPGTGKTMLARALAGESEAAFLPAAASAFVTRYQGSGPESVRDLFRKARRYAPAVLFIDEIDAIGRRRGDGRGSHGEEMALNALLTEMDGFSTDPRRPVFVLAATNFDIEEGRGGMGVLDAALVRRFDRRVLVGLPDTGDREALLRRLLAKVSACAVTEEMIRRMAERSVGMSPATLTGILEQANRMAAKAGEPLGDDLLEEAFELTKYGGKKDWGYESLERVARHESGHALVSALAGNTPAYLTIEARGDHGGYMEHSEKERGPLLTRRQLIDRIRTSLGGRAAEIVYYGEEDGLSTGASGDLQQATRTAAAMLCSYGMDEEFGLAAADPAQSLKDPAFRARVNTILSREMSASLEIIRQNRDRLDRLVTALLSKNRLTAPEIEEQLDLR